jgi:hypothetical protein
LFVKVAARENGVRAGPVRGKEAPLLGVNRITRRDLEHVVPFERNPEAPSELRSYLENAYRARVCDELQGANVAAVSTWTIPVCAAIDDFISIS